MRGNKDRWINNVTSCVCVTMLYVFAILISVVDFTKMHATPAREINSLNTYPSDLTVEC